MVVAPDKGEPLSAAQWARQGSGRRVRPLERASLARGRSLFGALIGLTGALHRLSHLNERGLRGKTAG